MHKNLKRFGMDGVINDDSDIPRLREQYENMVIRGMRDDGYVPILGLGPFWSTWYDMKKDWYEFVISIHGIYVGRRRACEIEGITVDGNSMMRPTPPSKSSTSSDSAK